jgi:hypothetical protein
MCAAMPWPPDSNISSSSNIMRLCKASLRALWSGLGRYIGFKQQQKNIFL